MKKAIFTSIMTLVATCLMTSCGPKTPDPVKLGESGLTAHAVLKDKSTETFLWGVKDKTGQQVIDNIFVETPVAFGEFFIGEKQAPDGQMVFDKNGKPLVEGNSCRLDFQPYQAIGISYCVNDTFYFYLIKEKKNLVQRESMLFFSDRIFYLEDEYIGLQNYNEEPILPGIYKKIIKLTVTKKQLKDYYMAQDENGWNLFDYNGTFLKKLTKLQAEKYQKGAKPKEGIDKYYYNNIPNL